MIAAVQHDTFILRRTYTKPAAAVFACFADPACKRRWYGRDATERYESEFREGGVEVSASRMGDASPFPGAVLMSESRYLDIAPDARIVMAQTMSMDGRRFSAALMTFEFQPSGAGGTEVVFTHQAAFFEGADGPQMRRHGWEALLERLSGELA